MTSPWYITDANASERDRRATEQLVSIILLADSARSKQGEQAPSIKAAVMQRGYSLKELKRLLPILETRIGE